MRSARLTRLAALLVCMAFLAPLSAQQVGELGDFERFEFRGVKTYSIEKLRGALQFSGDVQFAAHTTAPLDKFLAAVESFIAQGYRNGGFAEPKIRATVDERGNHVVVEVTEGPRYVQGEIIVSGGKQFTVDVMRRCLLDPDTISDKRLVIQSAAKTEEENKKQDSKKQENEKPPKWEPGEFIRFDERLQKLRAERLLAVLRDLGYLDAQIKLEIQPNDDSRTADLVVKVVDTGRPVKADRIEVRGLERNTPQQVLDYLVVSEGMRLDTQTITEMEERLDIAARFISHEVSLVRSDDGETISLIIDVMELPHAPLLNGEFDEKQLAFLRVGRWLDAWDSHASFMKCHIDTEIPQTRGAAILDFIVSPSKGLTGSFKAQLSGRDLQYGIAVTKARVAVYNAQRQRCYDHPPFPLAELDLKLGLVYKDDKIKSKVNLGGKLKSGLKLDAPLSFRIKAAPALLVHRASQPDTTWKQLENGLTTVSFEQSAITFDSNSGAIHEVVERSAEFNLRLTFGLDKSSEPHEDFAARYFGLENEYRADHPHASFIGFVVGEVLWNARADKEDADTLIRHADVLSNLVASKLGPTLESFSNNDKGDDSEKFHSPHPVSIPMTTDFRVLVSVLGPGAAEKLFPRGSWPWLLLREAAFTIQGRSQYVLDEIRLLLKSPDIGPVGCLLLAKMTTMAGAKQLSHEVADKGIEHLTLEGFRRDLALFTSGDKSAPQLLAVAVDVVRTLTAEEVTAICDLVNKPELTKQVPWLHLLLASDERPGNEVLADRLEGLWEPVLRSRLEQSLRKHLLTGIRRNTPFQP